MLDIIVPVIIPITDIWISLGWLRRDILWVCVYRATESQWSHGVDSPWTAMVFLSCRIVFPADTCTVTVLTPSRENVQATLPSRVITGCWGRKTGETEEAEGGERHRVRRLRWETLITLPLFTFPCQRSSEYTHTQTHTPTYTWRSRHREKPQSALCCTQCRGPTESSLCDRGGSFLSLLTSPFVLPTAMRC